MNDVPAGWAEKARLVQGWAVNKMWQTPEGAEVRRYLEGRGLSEFTMEHYGLGWVPKMLFRERADWGLADTGKKLCIPPGIVIPQFNDAFDVVTLRVRYWTPEHGGRPPGEDMPKYWTLSGVNPRCLVTGHGTRAVVVVESDLDALLVAEAAGDLVRGVALGSVQTRPDPAAADVLKGAPLVLVALDADDAGMHAMSAWCGLDRCEVWPVPRSVGKDPGEAHQRGYDLRAWIMAGIDEFQKGGGA